MANQQIARLRARVKFHALKSIDQSQSGESRRFAETWAIAYASAALVAGAITDDELDVIVAATKVAATPDQLQSLRDFAGSADSPSEAGTISAAA